MIINLLLINPCRKTATGMFSDCGVYSADLAWSANPYKGLNCPIKIKKIKKIKNNLSKKYSYKIYKYIFTLMFMFSFHHN